MQRIRKGDEVIVIAGKDKGKKGIVSALPLARVTASASRKLTARRFACSRATVPLSAPRPKEQRQNVSFPDSLS